MDAMSQKIRLENEYYVSSRATSVTAPTVVALKSQLDAVDLQIEQLQSKLTSNTPRERTIAASLGTFEELELKRIFVEKLYTMAQDALERARLRAEQQNIYLSTFVPPALPQDADYPNRFGLSMMTTCGLLMIWAILAMLSASIEDHRN
jgi:capsular polysaccharide transport system permease protein